MSSETLYVEAHSHPIWVYLKVPATVEGRAYGRSPAGCGWRRKNANIQDEEFPRHPFEDERETPLSRASDGR